MVGLVLIDYIMVTIGWFMLLLILTVGLRLGGIAVGLLSGLGVGLLACWIEPADPPYDLMLVQATWFLMMATLETTGFFYLLTTKLTGCFIKANYHDRLWIILLCYAVVFLTGDKKWLYQSICPHNRLHKAQDRLTISLAFAAHMALLASPLSISGILLILVAGNNGLPIASLVGIMGMMTVGITVLGSLLTAMIPDRWLKRLFPLLHHSSQAKDDGQVLFSSKAKVKFIFLFLLLAEILFLLIKPEANQLTKLICIEKRFPVRFSMFFALIMLSMGALAMLYGRLQPARILQTYRFKLGIQQFFIFLGLTWLFKTVMIHEKAYLLKALDGANPDYGFYLVAALYTLLIDPSMVVWLLSPLLIEFHCTIVTLAASLVLVHSLAPAGYWIRRMFNPHTKKTD